MLYAILILSLLPAFIAVYVFIFEARTRVLLHRRLEKLRRERDSIAELNDCPIYDWQDRGGEIMVYRKNDHLFIDIAAFRYVIGDDDDYRFAIRCAEELVERLNDTIR